MEYRMKMNKPAAIFLLSLVLILQLIIYAAHVGTGFVSDDFTWLGNVVVNGKVDYLRTFATTIGFYRPLVNITFGLQYHLHHLNPRPYGWFNLVLHLMNIILVFLLLSSVEITRPYALPAAVLFAFNIKGPTMAVGWISGRTDLLFAFFMLLSLIEYLEVRRQNVQKKRSLRRIFQYFVVGITYFAALLSKETAVALPVFVFLVSFFIREKENTSTNEHLPYVKRIQNAFQCTVVFLIPLILYCFMRFNSNAFGPFNAPGNYRYNLAPMAILKNFFEYITRAGMLDIMIILWLLIIFLFTRRKTKPPVYCQTKNDGNSTARRAIKSFSGGPGGRFFKKAPLAVGDGIQGQVLMAGAFWFICFQLPTLFLPLRSDIYIYVPQPGLHVMALPIIFYLYKKTSSSIRKKLNQSIIFLPIGIFILIYIVSLAFIAADYGAAGKNSAVFTRQVRRSVSKIPDGNRIVIIDLEAGRKLSPSVTVTHGFYALLNLYYPHKGLWGEIISPGRTAQIDYDKSKLIFFFWGNGCLAGPFDHEGITALMSSFYPFPSRFDKKPQEPEERLFRLKKRKMRLRQLKPREKQRENPPVPKE
jgi:hypothetical protein